MAGAVYVDATEGVLHELIDLLHQGASADDFAALLAQVEGPPARTPAKAPVAGVPMLWEDEVIGLLFVADRYHRTHTAQNISILSTLATHAAVAVKNAMAFEQANAALASAQAARAELERHVRNIQRAAEAHE